MAPKTSVASKSSHSVPHGRQESTMDVRLPGLETETIARAGSFRNQLRTIATYFTEGPRTSWMKVVLVGVVAFAAFCTSLLVLMSLDWPFLPYSETAAAVKSTMGHSKPGDTSKTLLGYEFYGNATSSAMGKPHESPQLTTDVMHVDPSANRFMEASDDEER